MTAFEALCRASVFGLAALFIALIAQFALGKRVPAAWRAWVWRVALLQSVFALLPLAPVRWEILTPSTPATSKTISAPLVQSDEFSGADSLDSPPLEIPDAARGENAPLEIPNTPIESAEAIVIPRAPSAPFDWRASLLTIYALGIAFQCAQLARGALRLRRVLNNCAPIENALFAARLKTLMMRLNLKRAPQLLQTASDSPFVTGVWRPRIILPHALCKAEQSQIDAILAHELAHLKRRDLVWLGATWLLQTLLWFHPLAWAARRFHGLETECACDELALQLAPIAPQSYGALLLNSMNHSKFSSPLAAGTCDTLFALKTRLLRLNNAPIAPRKTAKLAFIAALLLSCVAVVPLKLVARAQDAPPETSQAKPKSPLVGSAVVQGVITSRQTGKPIADMKLILLTQKVDSVPEDERGLKVPPYQESRTDTRGYFRFSAMGGQHMLLAGKPTVDLDGPKRSIKADSITVLKLKGGEKQDLKYKWDEVTKHFWQSSNDIFAGSAILQGIVISKQTGKPLAGVPMILVASAPKQISADEVSFSANGSKLSLNVKGTLPYAHARSEGTTDVRGYFRFNAVKGDYTLLADGKFMDRASKPTDFSAQGAEMLKVKDGQKRDFKFELDEMPQKISKITGTGNAVIQGVITSNRTKKPLVGLPMILLARKSAPKAMIYQKTETDARGYFRFNASGGTHRLLVDGKISVTAGKPTGFTTQEIYDFPLKDAEMRNFKIELGKGRIAPGAIVKPINNQKVSSASGQVTDENRRPLAGVTVTVYQDSDKGSAPVKSAKSDGAGRFLFTGLKPNSRTFISSSLSGYGGATVSRSKNGNDTIFTVTLPRASAALRGVVIGEDGQPARNFRVEPSACSPTIKTDAQGRFFLPQVVPGATSIRVSTPNGGNGWGPIKVRGGDQNVKIRLTRAISDARFPRPVPVAATSKNSSDKTRALIGKTAPEIQAFRWANGKTAPLASLHGKVVLLAFQDFTSGDKKLLSDFARSFAATARVVGIQINTGRFKLSQPNIDTAATRLGFPIAVDAPRGDGNGIGGYTLSAYGFGVTGIYGYAVVGRDGKVIYAGDELNRAIQFASR